jgi:repressor LexA
MLTTKQKRILEIIEKYINKNKISPTTRELANLSGIKSTSTIHDYLEQLKKKGFITWHDKMPRTIQVLKINV